jgi:uncharacterized protein YndB with AHSA1/START domain
MKIDTTEGQDERELRLERDIDVPAAKLFRAWTEPELLVRWFTPPPYVTVRAELDVRPGGMNFVVMRGPDGSEMEHRGVYLEVVPGRRLVFTDAYTSDWEPSDKPFMTVVLTFDDLGGGRTRYLASVRHWTVADREAHEAMGFHQGWGIATDQLAAVAAKL